ncbi:MAG TPA: hypothetical protein VIA06_04225 [Candidatus Dormibacteraeota bacterium]|jgi:hypothetical protein|nr:hypothetical protein [Candidatus Dormibacteraeota bacterium]
MSDPAPPQYSPDGNWWWDGSAWYRADPNAPPVGALPESEPAPPAVAPADTTPRRNLLMTLGGMVVAAVVVVAALGFGAEAVANNLPRPAIPTPAPSSASPPVVAVPYRYMPGVKVSDVTRLLERQGFSCESLAPNQSLGLQELHCQRQDSQEDLMVDVQAKDANDVHLIDATIDSNTDAAPSSSTATSLFGQLAALPLSSHASVASQAKAWVSSNLQSQASKTFRGIIYSMLPNSGEYVLNMDAGVR